MALVPSQVLRVAILLSYLSVLCHYRALDMPAHHTYGGSWKFLTFIDLVRPRAGFVCGRGSPRRRVGVIQAVFFGLCVLIDVSSLLTKSGASGEQERQLRKLVGLRDWMMAVLAFPVGAFVVFTFWSLYLYDRDLVYPKLLDSFIPQWLNHGMHTTVLPFIIIEMRTTRHRYPSRLMPGGRSCVRSRLHPLDLLGAPGDGCVGLPGAGAHRPPGQSPVLQPHDLRRLLLLHTGRNPQRIHLGSGTHRKGEG
ncbi:unnamed protein product [Tetraodon nigroviridis]|uniref:(spotted green pufferfish) hypothetical protein n=1 Tax=Tetraodon nigroviridis TaxID=99883 RepID=Q4T6K4_TETNG|nr:unnamed protein product [Tetraodon nigroviridis]